MASGITTTTNLTDSLNTMVAAARIIREYEGVVAQLVRKETLDPNTGLTWNEVSFDQLTASAVTETTELENAQQLSDTNFPITPTVVGLLIVITDRVKRRLAQKAYAKVGALGQNAINRKRDEDGIVVFDGFTSLSGAGTTLTTGIVSAASSRILGNATEPAKPPIRAVLHPFQVKDFEDQLVAGIGTYPVGDGPTASVFKEGFKLPIAGVEVYKDGNITIDSSDDAKGGVFAQEGIVLVQGKTPWTEPERKPGYGGGADAVWMYDKLTCRLAA